MTQRPSLTGPFGLSMAAIGVAGVCLAVTIPSLIVSIASSAPSAGDVALQLAESIMHNADAAKRSQDMFNGRSAFFRPPPIPPRKPIIHVIEDQPLATTQPKAEPCPDRYTGPTMIGFVGDEVWFKAQSAGEQVLRIPVGHASDDLAVLATDLPWTARVKFDNCEYTLALWGRQYEGRFNPPQPTTVPGLQIETTPREVTP